MGEQVDARFIWGCSSVGRAPALQAGGREFESLQVHQKRHCFLQCLFSFICAILKSGFERTDGSERQAKKKILILLFYQNSKLNSYFFNKNICG